MEVKIAVQHTAREIALDTNVDAEEVTKQVTAALSGELAVLELIDAKGRRILVPSSKIGFVELGSPTTGPLGFRGLA